MKLTQQEERVLALFRLTGGQNKQLAQELGIAKQTVDHYMHQIKRKLKVTNRNKLLIKGDEYV